jgi:hypothetical protein
MAASSEWTAHHLTPDGWVEGDKQRDFGQFIRQAAPDSRVLSVVYKETCNGYGPINGSHQEQWRSEDAVVVAELLAKFGTAPKEL